MKHCPYCTFTYPEFEVEDYRIKVLGKCPHCSEYNPLKARSEWRLLMDLVDKKINQLVIHYAKLTNLPEPLVVSNMAHYCGAWVGEPLSKYATLLWLVKQLNGGKEVLGE